MKREQAINYLISIGLTEDQVGEVVRALTYEPATNNLSVPEVTALAEWTEKLTKASEEAYNKGYADGMKAQEPRWIPVEERLPEKSMACLVAVGRFNFTQIAVYSDLMGIIDHQIFYQGEVGHDNFKNITQYVKAWMPLPEPYREVEE